MHRNSYDYAILEAGASIVEIGNKHQTLSNELENAISNQTIAVFWFQGAMNQPSEAEPTSLPYSCSTRRASSPMAGKQPVF